MDSNTAWFCYTLVRPCSPRWLPARGVIYLFTVFFTLCYVEATQAARVVLLDQSFDTLPDGTLPKDWKVAKGNWAVSQGQLRGVPEGDAEDALIYFGRPDLKNVAIEADISFIELRSTLRWFALIARDNSPASPGIQLSTHKKNNLAIAVDQLKDNKKRRILQTARLHKNFGIGKTYRLQLKAHGIWIRGYLDGEEVIRSPRGDEFSPGGRVGLRVRGVVVLIDNLKLYDCGLPLPEDLRPPRTRPLAIAHRGFSSKAPENTLAAYRLAIETGIEMAECDVRLSADKVPVLMHDSNLKRTTGHDAEVGDLTLEQLRKLDAGRWKAPEYANETIPTLKQLLTLAQGKIRLFIEIKDKDMEKEVVADIRAGGIKPRDLMIFSFHREVVEKIAGLEPHLPTTWLIGDLPYRTEDRLGVIGDALKARVSALGLPKDRVDPYFIRLAHESGFQVFVWTVDEPADMRFLVRIGVDGIISNRPDLLLNILKPGFPK
ncbi:MAG: hypothetical protein JSV03_04105 [Planctomycetota bacterium]|nr:MAG: hypothetical protein JSV03_04105 [Planctomycetota bacterium]